MEHASNNGVVFSIQRFHWAVRLDNLFFPLRAEELLELAQGLGYRTPRQAREANTPMRAALGIPSGIEIVPVGIIGTKEEVSGSSRIIILDSDRSILAIQGTDISEIIEEFDEVLKLAIERFRVDIGSSVRFFEYILEGIGVATYDPIEATKHVVFSASLQDKFVSALGFQPGNYGCRLVQPGNSPQANRWTEYRVEPLVQKPNSSYFTQTIVRDPDPELVKQSAVRAPGRIIQLIEAFDYRIKS